MNSFFHAKERGHFLQGLAMILMGLGALVLPMAIVSQPRLSSVALLLFSGSTFATALRSRGNPRLFFLLVVLSLVLAAAAVVLAVRR